MTTKPFKPMLAETAPTDNLTTLRYPMLASPKLDGIRAIIRDGVVMSRSMKPIRNRHVQSLFGRPELEGLDGELIVGNPFADDAYLVTTSGVMSADGEPDVVFNVFDHLGHEGLPYSERLVRAAEVVSTHPLYGRIGEKRQIDFLSHTEIRDADHLLEFEQAWLAAGAEGVMVRCPNGPYKQGRSTLKEGWLLKVKRFVDAEAEIIGFTELMHNGNEAKTNALGHTERSSAKEGLVPMNTLGNLIVRHVDTGVEFEIGTGFTAAQRADIWAKRETMLGQLAKFKSFPVGVKDKPRLPVFLGFRDLIDMSPETVPGSARRMKP
jgi:DNA ligase-1